MKRSFIFGYIGRQIFIYLLLLSLLIVGFIGFSVKFILPSYYLEKQLKDLAFSEQQIRHAYSQGDMATVESLMGQLQESLGGKLYYSGVDGGMGNEFGKGANRGNGEHAERFQPTGEITAKRYTNKVGLDIQVIGVKLADRYLVYEVSIQNLNKAVSAMMDVVWVLLGLALVLSLVLSLLLSRNISRPIQNLNQLAQAMKTKSVEPQLVTGHNDEIGILNQTLNELYEELRGNIFKLNGELNKERNAERLKKRFLAQTTHELKTPIAVIRGYAEILYDGMYKDEEECSRYVHNIYQETGAISRLINDVLDYTKLETGNYVLHLQPVSVVEVLCPMIERYRDFVEQKNLQFEIKQNLPAEFHRSMDKDRVAQVYRNLVSNAVEHARSCLITEVQSVGNKLKISVYNDGAPIDPEDIPNIFDSFYKAQGKSTGSGLGLAIVKEIVSLHGGEYWVENLEDGVRFVIVI